MTLDFDDLPPLTERCRKCYTEDGISWVGYGDDRQKCDCVNRERPTEFGQAVLDLVRKFLPSSKCE